jgi:hypothetical protein
MEPQSKQFRGLTGLQKSVLNQLPREKVNEPMGNDRSPLARRVFERNMAEADVFENANKSVKQLDAEYRKMHPTDQEDGVAVARGGAVRRARDGSMPSFVRKEDLDNIRSKGKGKGKK